MARTTDPATAVLGARVVAMEIRLARANLLPCAGTLLSGGALIVGPDDLERDPDVTRFQGFAVLRVPHWPGQPVMVVAAGQDVAGAYGMARRLQQAGVAGARIRAFGPAGWERVSLPFVGVPGGRLDFVPADGLEGPMVGVELT